MKPSTVSVTIATYNRARMVRQAIEAAFDQSYPPSEVVVTDDASPDGTWATLEELASSEPRLRIVRQEKNTGGVENWNRAVEESSGDYIAWCSDDDRFAEGHLEASVAYLDQHPEVGMVHAGFIDAVETEAGSEETPRPLRFPEDRTIHRRSLLVYLIRYYDWPFHPSTLVFRRRVWETVGRFDARFALADTDWFLRVAEQYPVTMLARHGVRNRRHPGNWSNKLGSARMQQEIRAMVEGAVDRIYPEQPVRRALWRLAWRWTVRLRLLLTVRARIRSGHGDAACAAWRQVFGRAGTSSIAGWGERWIARMANTRRTAFEDARQSVSPL